MRSPKIDINTKGLQSAPHSPGTTRARQKTLGNKEISARQSLNCGSAASKHLSQVHMLRVAHCAGPVDRRCSDTVFALFRSPMRGCLDHSIPRCRLFTKHITGQPMPDTALTQPTKHHGPASLCSKNDDYGPRLTSTLESILHLVMATMPKPLSAKKEINQVTATTTLALFKADLLRYLWRRVQCALTKACVAKLGPQGSKFGSVRKPS